MRNHARGPALWRLHGSVLLLTAAILSCTEPTEPELLVDVPACDGRTRGTLHTVASSSPQLWSRDGNPHVVLAPVAGALTIEAGAVVCVRPNMIFQPGPLTARGTAESPIVLKPLDGEVAWNGIALRGDGWNREQADLAHVHIRNTTGPGIELYYGTIDNVVIDSACSGGGYCSAIQVGAYSAVSIAATTIRDSGGHGIHVSRRSQIRINGGSIERSAGMGIVATPDDGGTAAVIIENPVRITGGRSYPANVPLSTATALSADAARAALITGNALDTLVVQLRVAWGDDEWSPADRAVIRRALPWHVWGGCGTLPHLELEPGARLTISPNWCNSGISVRFTSHATTADPVIVRGNGSTLLFDGTAPDTIRHVHLHNVLVRADGGPKLFDNVKLTASVIMLGTGSRLLDSSISGESPNPNWAAGSVVMAAHTELARTYVKRTGTHGVVVTGSGARIYECTISGNAGDGVRVVQGDVIVTNCNLEDNTGVGVANLTDAFIDATHNWWGDPAGPLGVTGDGVSGNVRFDPVRTTPFLIDASVTSLPSWILSDRRIHGTR